MAPGSVSASVALVAIDSTSVLQVAMLVQTSSAQASSALTEGKRTITVETVRFLAPGVALADGRYQITGGNSDRRMWASGWASRKAAWRASLSGSATSS